MSTASAVPCAGNRYTALLQIVRCFFQCLHSRQIAEIILIPIFLRECLIQRHFASYMDGIVFIFPGKSSYFMNVDFFARHVCDRINNGA